MKQCAAPECHNNAQSHGYCFRHGYLRVDEKAVRKREEDKSKKKPFSSIKQKPKEVTGEREMFLGIWATSEHKSWLTGADLNYFEPIFDFEGNTSYHKLFWSLFHHVLNKKKYPLFRLNEDNIIILTPQQHLDIHSLGIDRLREKYGIVAEHRYRDKYEELKQEYKNLDQ